MFPGVDEEREDAGAAEVEIHAGAGPGGNGRAAVLHGFSVDAALNVRAEVRIGGRMGEGSEKAHGKTETQGADTARRTLKNNHGHSPFSGMDTAS